MAEARLQCPGVARVSLGFDYPLGRKRESQKAPGGMSLVVQWLKAAALPVQGPQV